MKISDNDLREFLLEQLRLKGEQSTLELTNFGNTWASSSKVRDVLISLKEENLIKANRKGDTKSSPLYYSLVEQEAKIEVPDLKTDNDELNATLKHEFEIILRKQRRRRDWAAKILQNAETAIKHLEGQVRCL